jgi:hypothetical protein
MQAVAEGVRGECAGVGLGSQDTAGASLDGGEQYDDEYEDDLDSFVTDADAVEYEDRGDGDDEVCGPHRAGATQDDDLVVPEPAFHWEPEE